MNADSDKSRVYRIQSQEGYPWQAARTHQNEQVLLGTYDNWGITVFFNLLGELVRFEGMPILPSAESSRSAAHSGAEVSKQLLIDYWRNKCHIVQSAISIRHFFLPEIKIGIKDIPKHLEEFLRHPELVDDAEERQEWFENINDWRAAGRFVLSWGKEFWMSSDGEVTDT